MTQFVIEEVGPGFESITSTGERTVHYLNVHFSLNTDSGIKIGSATVSIGDRGQIVAFQGEWREVEEIGKIRIITLEEALKRLPSVGYGRTPKRPKKVIIEQMTLSYFDDNTLDDRDDFQPVYEVSCVLIEENGVQTPFIQRIPAAH